MDNLSDPNVSAVVTLRPRDGGPPSLDAIGRIKTRFSGTGFEVHAPFPMSFSILARRSLFERIFGVGISVDEESLAAGVTTESGELDLPLDQLPEDLREGVAGVAFMPPPTFAMPVMPDAPLK